MPFSQVSNNIRVVLESGIFTYYIISIFPSPYFFFFLLALHPLEITRVHSLGSHPPVYTFLFDPP